MSNLEAALATMDMAAVALLDQEAVAFEQRVTAQSSTWRYFFQSAQGGQGAPDIRGSRFYQMSTGLDIASRVGSQSAPPFHVEV